MPPFLYKSILTWIILFVKIIVRVQCNPSHPHCHPSQSPGSSFIPVNIRRVWIPGFGLKRPSRQALGWDDSREYQGCEGLPCNLLTNNHGKRIVLFINRCFLTSLIYKEAKRKGGAYRSYCGQRDVRPDLPMFDISLYRCIRGEHHVYDSGCDQRAA